MIEKIREGMTGKRVADVIYNNFEYILTEIGYNKPYDPKHYSGMGHIILDLHSMSNCTCGCKLCDCTTLNNILKQSDFWQSNTIYEIKYGFNLDGKTIKMPDDCILFFNGGSISNGTINLNGAKLLPNGWNLNDYFCNVELSNFANGQQIFDGKNLYLYIEKEGSVSTVIIDKDGNVTIDGDSWTKPESTGDVSKEEFDKLKDQVTSLQNNITQLTQIINTIDDNSYKVADNNGVSVTDPRIWTGTAEQYSALTKTDNVVYMIKED